MPRRNLICVLLPLVFAAQVPGADSLKQVLAKIDEAAASFRGLTADVTKVSYTEVIREKATDKGTLAVKRPKAKDLRMLFNITEPDPKQITYSGHTVEIYNPKMNVVDIYDVDKKLGSQMNQYLSLGFGASSKELQRVYTITYGGPETVAGQQTTRIVLTPKKPDVSIGLTKVELWISDATGLAVQQKLYERGGDYQLATYANMKLAPNISDSAVTLNAPRNAKREHPQ